jgi:predicted DNA-binding transcriptional regulator AlpA
MSILRTADVVRRTGLSRTTLWRLERKGSFPTRVQLGLNSVGWRVEEIDAWIDRRPRGIARSVAHTCTHEKQGDHEPTR